MTTTILDIALDQIEPSPTNPRKRFRHIDELADSIRVHKVLSPITVRPHPTPNGVTHQIVFGERRYRASRVAGEPSIPAIVRDMTDAEVAEAQLVENCQRDDVDPIDEAEGYQALIDHHGYTVDALVIKTGRSRAHLYGRLKLLELAPGPRDALADGHITASIAQLIARIPTPKLQEEALVDILGLRKLSEDDISMHHIEREDISPGLGAMQPLSFRATQALLHRKYATRLELACFEPGDADLVPSAGPCTTCPHNSGAQPGLFPDLGQPADVCTNPPCFEAKTLAVWKRAEDRAFDQGLQVIARADAGKVFGPTGLIAFDSPYVDPAAEVPWELRSTHGTAKAQTWEKLLGKLKAAVTHVLVQEPTGAPRELIDRAAAVAALIEAGKIEKPVKLSSSGAPLPTPEEKKADRQERAKEKAKTELREEAFTRVLSMVADVDPPETPKEWLPVIRWLLRTIEPLINLDAREMIGARRDKDLDKLVVDAPTLSFAFRLLAEMLVAEQCDAVLRGVGKRTNFDAALTLFHVDWEKAQALAKAAADAEKKADAAKKKTAKAGGK